MPKKQTRITCTAEQMIMEELRYECTKRSFLIDDHGLFQRLYCQVRETGSFPVTKHDAHPRRAARSSKLGRKHLECYGRYTRVKYKSCCSSPKCEASDRL
ncbi:hypothetical protein TNCV_677571 [Trichonephila clavipes]|nr:hypothetical protein TNCV_677571 [Trichonephila clavipes]